MDSVRRPMLRQPTLRQPVLRLRAPQQPL